MAINVNDVINFTGTDENGKVLPVMDKRYGPYRSVEEALGAISPKMRSVGLTVGILGANDITEYWFHTGTDAHDLVPKVSGDGDSCPCSSEYNEYVAEGGLKERDAYYAALKKLIDEPLLINLHSNIDNVEVKLTLNSGETKTVKVNG